MADNKYIAVFDKTEARIWEKLFIYLALAKSALPGQFVLFVSS
jgi:hypothetical protein